MKKLLITLLSTFLIFCVPAFAIAQDPTVQQEIQQEEVHVEEPEKFYLAQVKEVLEEGERPLAEGMTQPYQRIKLGILNGDEQGKEVEIEHGSLYSISDEQKVKKGQLIVLTKSFEGGENYYIADLFRLHILGVALAVIVLIWAILGRGRNLGMIVALLGTFAVAFYYLIPQVVNSTAPYIPLVNSLILMLLILVFIGFGLSKKTILVFASSLLTSLLIVSVSYLFFETTGFTGTQSEKASFYLQNGILEPAAIKNLFLASIVTGTLGIIAFLSHRQVNLVEEMRAQHKKLSTQALFKEILINPYNSLSPLMAIIFIAYLSVNLTLVLLFTINPNLPFWVTFNSEYVFGEVLRILVSMAAVVLIVPVTTYFAVNFLGKK